jgi:undecaprenyl-diphosphatase
MAWLEMFVLAVVQGIGEFLPISSKGHLVLGESLMSGLSKADDNLTIGIVLHMGTLATILVFYWRRILGLLKNDWRAIGLVCVGTVPVAVVGLIFKHQLEELFKVPLYVGLFLPVTGIMLLWSARHQSGQITLGNLTFRQALVVGIAQIFALLPGISRSGTTIVAGLGVGMRRDEAASFSFLLAIPAVAGACLLHLKDMIKHPEALPPLGLLVMGAAVSFLVGLAALCWLERWLEKGRMHLFAWYVIPLGVAVLIWQREPLWALVSQLWA